MGGVGESPRELGFSSFAWLGDLWLLTASLTYHAWSVLTPSVPSLRTSARPFLQLLALTVVGHTGQNRGLVVGVG
eukprot:6125786-Amphidinium_carterae.1